MSGTDLLVGSAVAAPSVSAPSLVAPVGAAFDADFETRWNAWVARGRAHEAVVRRRFLVFGPALALAGAILFAFLRS